MLRGLNAHQFHGYTVHCAAAVQYANTENAPHAIYVFVADRLVPNERTTRLVVECQTELWLSSALEMPVLKPQSTNRPRGTTQRYSGWRPSVANCIPGNPTQH